MRNLHTELALRNKLWKVFINHNEGLNGKVQARDEKN